MAAALTVAGGAGPAGPRWGGLVLDRARRVVVAPASGPRAEERAARVFAHTTQRAAGPALPWCSDGGRPAPEHLRCAARPPGRTGRRGRPPGRLPDGSRRTPTSKHRDERGRLLRVETRATCGVAVAQPALVPVERRNGGWRERRNARTRKTHACAKTATTGDALLDLHVCAQHWLHPHPALRQPVVVAGRVDDPRTPAMTLRLTDHRWTWREFLMTPTRLSS